VIVDQVELEVKGKGWVGVLTSPVTIDLLKLDGKNLTSLGVVKLPPGTPDDIRLRLNEIGDYVQLKDGTTKPLEVPADGILHINGTFDIQPCATGTIIIDFDPKLKTEDEPGRREYELEPIATIKTVKQSGSCAPMDAGSKHDMSNPDAGAGDGGQLCGGGICAPNEKCVNNMCVPDPCFMVLCPTGEMCDPNTGSCVPNPPDMSQPPHQDGGMDGSCHK
jgi:hypothetical protein